MPLDIMPAPTALPGAAPSGAADAPPGLPLAGARALLFGLLLAQTVGQAAAEGQRPPPNRRTPARRRRPP